MQSRFLIKRRNAHQAGNREAQLITAQVHKLIRLLRHNAGRLRLSAGVDLHEQLDFPALPLHFAGKYLGNFRPVNRFNDIKQGHCICRLVALQGPNQMQPGAGKLLF